MPAQAPLLSRPLSDAFCIFTQANTDAKPSLKTVSCAEFLSDVFNCASRLPESSHAINLCTNRYHFLVAFCAVIVRGVTNLLPPNKNIATQQLLVELYPDTYVIHNGDIAIADSISSLDVDTLLNTHSRTNTEHSVPSIALDHLAAISFTSGSTGRSQPIHKTWGSMVAGSAINSRYFLPECSPVYLLATVPAQHMWGLETSVYLPLFNNVCVSYAQPLFAQDIVNHLTCLPKPRLLVSTPVHLRYLLSSKLDIPPLKRVLCATSPLTKSLAAQVESACSCELIEVYGCSEVGSMACRQTSEQVYWSSFEGLSFVPTEQSTRVIAKHLPVTEVELQDKLSFIDTSRFSLLGRNSDAINIAGKRGSVSEITGLLLSIDKVRDAAVILTDQCSNGVERVVAVVESDLKKSAIRSALRAHLDPVFIPKSIFLVDRLPRESSGKLPRQALLELIERL